MLCEAIRAVLGGNDRDGGSPCGDGLLLNKSSCTPVGFGFGGLLLCGGFIVLPLASDAHFTPSLLSPQTKSPPFKGGPRSGAEGEGRVGAACGASGARCGGYARNT